MARSKNDLSAGWLVLFSLPFAGVGIFMLGWVCTVFWQALEMRRWAPVPMKIVAAHLESHRGSKGGSTYTVTARYEYQYQAQTYTGDRVSLHSGADNVGSFHQRTAAALEACQRENRPFTGYVNPARPGESILIRTPRLEMIGFMLIFGLVFGGAGFGLLGFSVAAWRQQRAGRQLAAASPEEPWRHRPQWATGRLRSTARGLLLFATVFATVWNLISSPILFILPGELAKGNTVALVALLFPAVGLGLAIWAGYLIARWLKYGESEFEMARVPGVIGGTLEGLVRIKTKVQPPDGFQVRLACVRRVTSGSGKNRSTRESVLWEDARVVRQDLLAREPGQSAVPILFGIPAEAHETDDADSADQTLWRLSVKAAVPGVDYAAQFEVPVFKTPDSDPHFQPEVAVAAAVGAPLDLRQALARAGVRYQKQAAGTRRVEFPMARNWGSALGLTVFFLFWTGALVLTLRLKAPVLFPVILGLIDVGVFVGLLYAWFDSRRLEADAHHLTVAGGLFGLGAPKRLAAAEVKDVEVRQTSQSNSTCYHGLWARLADGRQVKLAGGLAGRWLADALAADLQAALRGDAHR